MRRDDKARWDDKERWDDKPVVCHADEGSI